MALHGKGHAPQHGNLQGSDDDDEFSSQTALGELAPLAGTALLGYAIGLPINPWQWLYEAISRRAYGRSRASVVASVEPFARFCLSQIFLSGMVRLPNRLISTPCT